MFFKDSNHSFISTKEYEIYTDVLGTSNSYAICLFPFERKDSLAYIMGAYRSQDDANAALEILEYNMASPTYQSNVYQAPGKSTGEEVEGYPILTIEGIKLGEDCHPKAKKRDKIKKNVSSQEEELKERNTDGK